MSLEAHKSNSPALTPEKWRRIETVLYAALRREPGERSTFLSEACGEDHELRQEVESLLAGEGASSNWLDQPLAELMTGSAGTIPVDTLLGNYRILEPIGVGGMGQVYRARDERLGRVVAIKTLPASRSADPERRQRFLQEAKAVSALQHPNIVTFHDLAAAGDQDFLVMEYVAGATLDRVIPKHGLSFNHALDFAIQITDGLSAAHSALIVHRDLKPGNIMVSESGQIKLLDFGIAKLVGPPRDCVAEPALTQAGMIVGTAAYMSPEQAEGRKVDARSDIFSFGVVLYEMLTGRPLFRRESVSATLAAVVHEDPPLLSEVALDAPPELARILRSCLRKDPVRRIQHMADVKLALQDLKEDSDSGRLRVPATAPRRRWPWPVLASGVSAVLLGVVITQQMVRSSASPPPPVLTRLTYDSGLTTDPALSPDGKLLAFSSDRAGDGNLDIWIKQVGGSEPIRLTRNEADESEPSFSPDGTAIVFRSDAEGGGIFVIPALGGSERKVAGQGRHPRFSPDGKWIAYWTGRAHGNSAPLEVDKRARMFVTPASGGPSRQLRSEFAGAAYPVWSPDAKHILFLGAPDTKNHPEESIDWWVTPLDDTAPSKTGVLAVTRKEDLSGPIRFYTWALVPSAWEPGGDSISFSANAGDSMNLWRIPIDPSNWRVKGKPVRLTSGPALEEKPSAAWPLGAAARIAFAVTAENVEIFSLPVAVNEARISGETRQLTTNLAADFHPSLSPDGQKLVFVSNRTGAQEIWIRDLTSGDESALTATRTGKYMPLFSPDGTLISFSSYEHLLRWETYAVPKRGGAPEKLCDGLLFGWSSDGTRVLHHEGDWRIRLFEIQSRRDSPWMAMPGRAFCCGRFSPDDRWVAFFDNGSWRSYIAAVPGNSPVPETEWIDLGEGQILWWSPDGNTIYGHSERDGHLCLWAQRLDAATKRLAGSAIPIFHSHSTRRSMGNQSHPHPFIGRDSIVFSMGERTANIWMAEFR